jgi:Lrp/AsnC family transcriptional regulator, leucine-responsive regulatory protein
LAVSLDLCPYALDLQVEARLEIFKAAIANRPEVLECFLMTGDAD